MHKNIKSPPIPSVITRESACFLRLTEAGEETGGNIFELVPVKPYPENYSACIAQAKKEIREGRMPELKAIPEIPDYCDTVFIGWSTMAPPVSAFLSTADLSGKKIVPFFSHGGGGAGHFVQDLTVLCSDSTLQDPLILTGNGGHGAAALIASWLNGVGYF